MQMEGPFCRAGTSGLARDGGLLVPFEPVAGQAGPTEGRRASFLPLVPCCGKSKVPLGAPWGEGSAAPQTTSDCGEFSHWAAAPVLRGDRTPKTES